MAIKRENPSISSIWACVREKKCSITNQPPRKKGTQVHNRNISPIWEEAPTEWIEMKIYTDVDLGT